MRAILIGTALLCGVAAHAQVNTLVTDGSVPFAEGVLEDYVVQADGAAICSNPHVIGRYISCKDEVSDKGMVWRAQSHQRVWVETNGTLGAMIVVDQSGSQICSDPSAWNKFRGPISYIVCNE